MQIDKYISTLVSDQFPQFYQAEGQNFISFVKAYYEWMEQEGYTINASKNLLDYSDIDKTIDEFVENFKNKYLVDFPSITSVDKRFIIKRIKDFYKSKGSEKGIKLLFRLLFDEDIEIYSPGKDILKASDGIWKIPIYIELEHNPRNITFLSKQITGVISGATAFVESVYTKNVNQRQIDIVSLSSLQGNFLYGELVIDDGNLFNAPAVIGSLTQIQITDGGANNKVGDIFEVNSSTSGKGGKVRVAQVTDGTGRVNIQLLDGGSGYTLDPDQVNVSNVVVFTTNRSAPYNVLERVTQTLDSVFYSIVSQPIDQDDLRNKILKGYDETVNPIEEVATGIVVGFDETPNTFILNTTTGNFGDASVIKPVGNAYSLTGYVLTNVTSYGTVTGFSTTSLGLHDTFRTFYANGALAVSESGVTANIVFIASGSGANFEIGSLSDTEEIFLFTDFIGSNNVNYVPYLNIIISGSNSNTNLVGATGSISTSTTSTTVTGSATDFENELQVGFGIYANVSSSNVFVGTVNSISSATSLTLTENAKITVTDKDFKFPLGYGFPKDETVGFNGYISDALTANAFTIGTIASLRAVNPGTNYNANPFVLVRNNFIAGFNRRNILLEVTDKSGVFSIGDSLTQDFITPVIEVLYDDLTNNIEFNPGEGVTQDIGAAANTFATIKSIDPITSEIVLTDLTGNILANSAGGDRLVGLSSGASANVVLSSGASITTLSRGRIVSLPTFNTIIVKRDSFNENFQSGSIVISSSGGTAQVLSATQDPESQPMGNNAVISANVTTAAGIASVLEILNSGVGHQPGDIIELVTEGNQFAITGVANVYSQGKGDGYWTNNQGKLNSDKYIIDNSFYQNYSYEVRSTLSLNKYSDILKKLAHVAGTKMFGKVLINSFTILPLIPVRSEYPDTLLINRSGAILLQDETRDDSSDDKFIITRKRNYSVTAYTGIEVYDRFENRVVAQEQLNGIIPGEDSQIILRY